MNFKTLVLSSVVGITSIFGVGINEAQARPHRVVNFTTNSGTEVYFRPVGSNGVHVLVDNKFSSTGFIGNMDCGTGRYQWRANTGYSQNEIEDILNVACDF